MLRNTYHFLSDILANRSLIYELVKRDYKQEYMGSYLGSVWVFAQPIMFVSILYAVFTLGFRAGESIDMPFSLYLVIGMVSWMYFSNAFAANTNAIKNYSFLVKKMDFRLSILPVVKLLSSLVPHIVLLILAILFAWIQGYHPTIYTLQVVYYMFSMCMLLLGLAWLTASTSIFVKDVNKVVSILVQFGFWLTPIFWSLETIPDRYHWIVELNPMLYIVNGYRESLISHVPFWESGNAMYFWSLTILIMYVGISVFRKLRPHFAEVV